MKLKGQISWKDFLKIFLWKIFQKINCEWFFFLFVYLSSQAMWCCIIFLALYTQSYSSTHKYLNKQANVKFAGIRLLNAKKTILKKTNIFIWD